MRHPNGQYDVKAVKKVIDRSAADLDEYVARTDVEIPIFADAFATAMQSFGRAISVRNETSTQDLSELRKLQDTRAWLGGTIRNARDAQPGLRDSLASQPRISSILNKARRRAVDTIERLAREFEQGWTYITELENMLADIKGVESTSARGTKSR